MSDPAVPTAFAIGILALVALGSYTAFKHLTRVVEEYTTAPKLDVASETDRLRATMDADVALADDRRVGVLQRLRKIMQSDASSGGICGSDHGHSSSVHYMRCNERERTLVGRTLRERGYTVVETPNKYGAGTTIEFWWPSKDEGSVE